jgi:very-short-patch-repair endonuclease
MSQRQAEYVTGSAPEVQLAFQIRAIGLPAPVREFRFAKPRRWRADFAYPEQMLLIEVEGGVYTRGRHLRVNGYENDLEKYNTATLLGYRVLRFSSGQVSSGEAVAMIERALVGEAR